MGSLGGLAIYQLPEGNLVKAAQEPRPLWHEARKRFPPGLEYTVALDTSTTGYGRH